MGNLLFTLLVFCCLIKGSFCAAASETGEQTKPTTYPFDRQLYASEADFQYLLYLSKLETIRKGTEPRDYVQSDEEFEAILKWLEKEADRDKKSKPKDVEKEQVNEEEETCCICLENYKNKDQTFALKECGHKFHLECLANWRGFCFAVSVRDLVRLFRSL